METSKPDSPLWFLEGGGVCGATARAVDWAKTALGPPESWSPSLKSVVAMLLHSRHPMFLWWGEELVQIYNDAYLPSFGKGRHPSAMGQRGIDCWQEIWPIIWPQIDDVMLRRKASWNEDHLVPILRNDRLEEVYWTYGYSPVFDEQGTVAGTLVVCTETTGRVISERRLRAIQSLAEGMSAATGSTSLFDRVATALSPFPHDVPFAQIYRDTDARGLKRAMSVGLDASAEQQLSDQLEAHLAACEDDALDPRSNPHALPLTVPLSCQPWPELVTQAYVAPLRGSGGECRDGWIVFGVSPRLPLNDAYRQHLEHVAERISLALARQHAELERERLLREVRAEQERLTNLFAQAPAVMCVLEGPDHVFALANERYLELIGRRDIIGKTVLEVLPEVRDQGFIELLDEVYRTGESYLGLGVPLQLQRGPRQPPQALFIDFVYQAFRDPNGSIVGIVVHGVDQTDRHNAEQAMKDADRRKDEFLAILAHELRNPLAPIANYGQLLDIMAHDPESVKKASVTISRQVQQMVRLIDDLLDASRISSGKIALRRETIKLQPVVSQAMDANQAYFDRGRKLVHVAVPSEPIFVNADSARLCQIIGNVLHNAAKFSATGGNIWVTVERGDDSASVRVRDDGIGIDSAQLASIFQMFTQADTSLERSQSGLGIGLGLVRNLVELHGGTVIAHSDGVGKGSEFIVRLPIVEAHTYDEHEKAGMSATHATGIRILIVDDNRDACDSMKQLLRASGYDTRIAYDGLSGVNEAEKYRPDAVLLDLGMPKLNGYEACQRIRGEPWGQAMKLIALTGWGQIEDKQRTAQAGFDAHLVKPVDITVLEQLLDSFEPQNSERDRRGSKTTS